MMERPGKHPWRAGLRVAAAFLVFGVLWITLSDRALTLITNDPEGLTRLQTYKGWAFVAGTAVLIFFMVVREVRARIEAEAQLLERSEFQRSLLLSSPVAILALDHQGKALTWNPAAEHIFGWSAEEVLGETLPAIPSVQADAFQALLERVREGETLNQMDLSLVRKDGTPVLVSLSASPIRTQDGRVVGVTSAIADITKQRRAERSLVEERALHSKIMETSPVGITVLDSEGAIVFANPFAEELLGLTLDEMTRRRYNAPDWTITDLDGGPFPDEKLPFRQVMASGRPVLDVRHGIRNRDGERILLSVNAAPLKGEAGEITGVVAVIEDITDRIANQKEREQMEGQLRQAQRMEAVGRLAGGVAHDFNNMLAVILGSVEMALATVPSEHPVFQDLTNIHTSATRSAKLTRQLLAFSRKQVIQPRVVDLNQVIRGQEKILSRLMGEEIHVHLELEEDLWPAYIDPSQVDQVLTNLLVNARDAIHGTGIITVATRNAHMDSSHARERFPIEAGPYVLLSVQDTGDGIKEETLEHIFEPFFTTKDHGKGTGLGLATVYGIVKQNQGFIDVDSRRGDGTTFTVCLPRHEGPTEEEASKEGAVPQPGSETILVVEDEELVGKLASRFLESQGYRVHLAHTPRQALAQVESMDEVIHLLITDVVLPEMSGKELQAAVKALRPDIKVLYMSGYSSDIIAERGIMDAGVNFIEKPFATGALGRQVREILDG